MWFVKELDTIEWISSLEGFDLCFRRVEERENIEGKEIKEGGLCRHAIGRMEGAVALPVGAVAHQLLP